MGRSIPVTVGSKQFASKREATDYADNIRHKYPPSQGQYTPVTDPQDEAFIQDLFKMHPEYAERTKNRTITGFSVGLSDGGTTCFYTMYRVGKPEDFSVRKCLRPDE
jgi:hypothetical protein